MRKGNMKDRFINAIKNTSHVIPREEEFPNNGKVVITYQQEENVSSTKVVFLNGIVVNTVPIIKSSKVPQPEFRGKNKRSISNWLKEATQSGIKVYIKQMEN